MRISVVSSFFLPVPAVQGGAMEKIWFRLAREFAQAGHDVTHVSRRWPGFPHEETLDGIRMLRLRGHAHTPSLPLNLAFDTLWGLRVLRALPPADVLACNTITLPVHAPVLRPSAGKVAVVLGRMPKGHARFYGRVARLIATSEAVRIKVVQENPALASRTRMFPNPIDWALHQAPRSPNRVLTIGYVGRLNPEKGLENLIQAAAQLSARTALPPWQLRIIGPQSIADGGGGEAYVDSLRRLAAAARVTVSIEPPVYDASALAQRYASFDVFCYPSLAEKGEGLSVAPLEAMAAGAVPVLSSLDCYRDVIRDGENGLCFDHRAPDAPHQLAGRLASVLADATLRHQLADAARESARRFDYSRVASDLLADFATLR